MRSLLIFLVITFLTLNANAQLGDLFRKLGDIIDANTKQNKVEEVNKSEDKSEVFVKKEGQTIAQINSEAWIYCEWKERKKDRKYIILDRVHPDFDNLQIFKVSILNDINLNEDDLILIKNRKCDEPIYFLDGKNISSIKVNHMEIEFEKLKIEKINILNKFIADNNLKLLNDFINVPANKFRIYENESKIKLYSINYTFVESSVVQSEINLYTTKKDTEIELAKQEIELAKKVQIENELKEKIIAEENRKRDEFKRAESALNELIQKNELEVLYRNESFLITKNRSMKLIYIKNGKIQKPNDVKDDIDAYNNFITRQEKQKKESAELKQRNLSYRWIVQAQIVCGKDSRCWIKGVTFDGNEGSDAAARFSISYESWIGSGGSSGVTIIECGFSRTNYIKIYSGRNTITAVCQ